MKWPLPHKVEKCRVKIGPYASDKSFKCNGAFFGVEHNGEKFTVLSSDGEGWEHVSVSLQHRTPTWEEMCHFKGLFFKDEEAVVQYHPPKSAHINIHNHCLHLWRPLKAEMPMPPVMMVG